MVFLVLYLMMPWGRLNLFTHLTCCERLFSQMSILEMVFYLVATEILVCEISERDDRASSCNHDMDLVIGGITLMLIGTLGER